MIRYEHDAAVRIVSRTNAADETLTFTRDPLGRPTAYAGNDVTTFEYDTAGNQLRARNTTS